MKNNGLNARIVTAKRKSSLIAKSAMVVGGLKTPRMAAQ